MGVLGRYDNSLSREAAINLKHTNDNILENENVKTERSDK